MFWQLQPVIQVDWLITSINETIQTYNKYIRSLQIINNNHKICKQSHMLVSKCNLNN